MYCRFCGSLITDNALVCPVCGRTEFVTEPRKSRMKRHVAVKTHAIERAHRETMEGLEEKIVSHLENEMILDPVHQEAALIQQNTVEWNGLEEHEARLEEEEAERSYFEEEEPAPKPPKKHTGLIITLIVSLSLLVIAVILGICMFSGAGSRLKRAAADRNFRKAETIYKTSFQGTDREKKAEEILAEAVDKLVADYKGGAITGDKAEECLTILYSFWPRECAEAALADVRALEASHRAFDAADTCFSNENYLGAIEYYGQVIEGDVNYAAAQAAILEARSAYEEQTLAKAEKYISDHEFESARTILTAAKENLVNSTAIDRKLSEIEGAEEKYEIESTLSDARILEQQGNYYQALKLAEKLLKKYPADHELSDFLETEKKTYRDKILEKAETALGGDNDMNYNAAISVLDTEIQLLGEEYPELTAIWKNRREELSEAQKSAPVTVMPGTWECISVKGSLIPVSPGIFKTLEGKEGSILIEFYEDGQYYLEILDFYENGRWSGGKKQADGTRDFTLAGEGEMRQLFMTKEGKLQLSYQDHTYTFQKSY